MSEYRAEHHILTLFQEERRVEEMVDAAVVAAAGAAVEAELRLVVRSVDIRIAAGLAVDSVLASIETDFMNNVVLAMVEDD